MRFPFLIAGLSATFIWFEAVVCAQPPAQKAAATATPALSAERVKRLDSFLQKYVDDNQIAGAVALVLRDGNPVYEHAVGWSDKEAGRKMRTDTIFRIASQTKAITSTAVLALMEEGKIGITEPVSHFIPSFAKTTVAVKTDAGDHHGSRQASDNHTGSADPHRRYLLRHRAAGGLPL